MKRPCYQLPTMSADERLQSDGSRHNFGILCHRQYADRIRDALLPSNTTGWSRFVPSADIIKPLPLQSTTTADHAEEVQDPTRKCIAIPTPDEKGARKSRIGYSLLVIEGAVMSPANLPPMARKQISWAGELTHYSALTEQAIDSNSSLAENAIYGTKSDMGCCLQTILVKITRAIWTELAQSSYDAENEYLRIDVHPKSYNSIVCNAFTDVVKPKSIKLACSASKVSHIVNLIVQSSSTKQCDIYWGISSRKRHFDNMNHRLNDNATSEIIIHSTSHKRPGKELQSDEGLDDSVQWDTPVSRAYYKLAQVFEDEALLGMFAVPRQGNVSTKNALLSGTGVDIGASPGGWTQVLCNILGIPTVVALDPGMLATRVMTLPGVHHICAELSSEVSISVLSQNSPYSIIVCDACMSNANELLEKIVDTFGTVATKLKKSCEDRSQEYRGRSIFLWPFCLVITLKLPYKTIGSIDRNLEKVNQYIPKFLNQIASLGVSSLAEDGGGGDMDVEIRSKICHLFANSISERTLIAVFNRK